MRHPEHQYLDLLDAVLERGDERIDRTGVGTRSLFGAMLRFDLSDGTVPILTTKRVYWKTAVKEMLWFLTGGTNLQPLLRENVRIWTDWPLAAYRRETGEAISQDAFERRILEDNAFAARWGELGPVYGKQWRRWLGAGGSTIRWPRWSAPCARRPPAAGCCSMPGTCPNWAPWRCRPATWSTSTT